MGSMAERAQIVIKGIVQGVGFRPYVYNLAGALELKGYVTNTAEGVFIDVEGARVPEFVHRLRTGAPPLSHITDFIVTPLPVYGYADFAIQHSRDHGQGMPFTLVSPDTSICDDCLREMSDPADRRYLYPFINCTNCGPRYSITRSVPYDRPNTTMAGFVMCPDCQGEYKDPGNRRFHAQPNACVVCGPQVEFKSQSVKLKAKDKNSPIEAAISILKQGGIMAVKGIGGFHIACDAANDDAVKQLRGKKRKRNKPFAVMSPDIRTIEGFCHISDKERDLLQSNRRPIVLLRKKAEGVLSSAVSPNNNYMGCMLPYTPLHYLLFHHPIDSRTAIGGPHFQALVMTSGNLSEEPIVRDNGEAVEKLGHIADGFLVHDRDIFMRVDDTVVKIMNQGIGETGKGGKGNVILSPIHPVSDSPSQLSFLRRSRGYAPDPISLQDDGPEVLGCGADLKNTFTLTKGKFAIPSQHIGDMENYETLKFYEECLANLKNVYRTQPQAIGHDLHPGYFSTRWAMEQGARDADIKLSPIQHHYAHVGSVMAEHGLKSVIGVAFDGTGYGTDSNLWGGEFLIADIEGFERVGQLKYVSLPGGEGAIREPWKTAVSYVMDAAEDKVREHLATTGFIQRYGKEAIDQIMIVARSREFSPLSSGAGRLFDAVSALLGICDKNTFEGEAAMALESFTQDGIEDEYQVEFLVKNQYTIIDFSPTIIGLINDMKKTAAREIMATKFHNSVASAIRMMVKTISRQQGLKDIALSGGTFQNLYLNEKVRSLLSQDGMNVYLNQKVPCNDACISLGQAYLVRERMRRGCL